MSTHWKSAAAGLAVALLCGQAGAQETIKIGIISHFSGPFAMAGVQFRQGIDTFIAQHGTKVGGREVQILYRDVGGSNPATSKQLAEELIVRDKVALLGGFYLSPDASAVASVVTETKTPTVIFNAAAPPIVRQSPYFVRVSNTVWQDAVSTAEWAHMQGKQNAYIAVADFAPGYDLEEGFKWKFTGLGGKIVGDDHIPLNTVDYASVAERIASQPSVHRRGLHAERRARHQLHQGIGGARPHRQGDGDRPFRRHRPAEAERCGGGLLRYRALRALARHAGEPRVQGSAGGEVRQGRAAAEFPAGRLL